MMGKIFAIGDIHGCLGKIESLMKLINIDAQRDTVVFLGDYIDRGPDPRGVVQFIIEFKKVNKNVICLLGNHEELFIEYLKDRKNEAEFYVNGGLNTLASYDHSYPNEIPASHRLFLASLLPYYETEGYLFVHAGFRPGVPLEEQRREDMLWIRSEFINSDHDFGKKVIFGHTHFPDVFIDVNKIGIDTGAVYGGRLTCLELPVMKTYCV